MSIDVDLYKGLKNHAGLKSLIGSKIYPDKLPQKANLPAVTYFLVSSRFNQAMNRQVASISSLFQVSVWAETQAQMLSVMAQARNALLALNGDSVTLYSVMFVDEREMSEPDLSEWRRDIDVEITHSEG